MPTQVRETLALRNSAINVIMFVMKRREYEISPIIINRKVINKVIIDPHYERKHSSSIDDQLILGLVKKLNGHLQLPDDQDGEFSYFATVVELRKKQYRLIWLLENEEIYIGIVNAFRDSKGE